MSPNTLNGQHRPKRTTSEPPAASLRPTDDSRGRLAFFNPTGARGRPALLKVNEKRGRFPRSRPKPSRVRLGLFCLAACLLCLSPAVARAQTTEAHLSVVSLDPPRLKVEGRRAAAAKVWSFRNAYAGALGLAERIENLSLTDEHGASVPARKLAAGEYEAERAASGFSYEFKLDAPAAASEAAHVSWLTPARGLLMPGDLLPLPLARARLRFTLPPGWQLASLDENAPGAPAASGTDVVFDAADAESSVFLVGRDVRRLDADVKGMKLAVSVSGDWAFADRDLLELVTPILREHARAVGVAPGGRAHVILTPFPRPTTPGQWSAETRGATVTFLSGRVPSKQSALARLGDPLVHELFHLWIPNALKLGGDYDWFYEGFTLYHSLRVGQRLGRLTFDDYLGALARANDNYLRARDRDGLSLVEASARRWNDSALLVYQKGMLTAFLFDLNLRQRSGGKRSLEDVYRTLFSQQNFSRQRDGNAAAVEALNDALGSPGFTDGFVKSARRIDLAAELSPFGLRASVEGGRTRITVAENLTGPQRALLRQIGYN